MKARGCQQGFVGLSGVALYAVVALGAALLLSWAGSGVALWWLDAKLEAANKRAQEAGEARASEEQSRNGFQAAAGSCSASVARLAAAGEARDRLWAEQLGRSAAQREKAEGEAALILSGQRKAGEDECAAMKRGLDEEIDSRASRK